jgi:hypothetical protein
VGDSFSQYDVAFHLSLARTALRDLQQLSEWSNVLYNLATMLPRNQTYGIRLGVTLVTTDYTRYSPDWTTSPALYHVAQSQAELAPMHSRLRN